MSLPATLDGVGGARLPEDLISIDIAALRNRTDEWKATICAHSNLRLVYIDEDPRVSQWPPTSITLYDTLVCPPNWLLVNQANGCFGRWLSKV
jgi:hypothetical protein